MGYLIQLVLMIVILIIIFYGKDIIANIELDHYDMSKVDHAKINMDMINGVSVSERRRRCVNGYYDKDEK